MTPEERLREVLEQYPPCDEYAWLDNGETLALVERSVYDGSYYVTTHRTLDDAAGYRAGQERPEDWHFVTLVSLLNGTVFDEVPSYAYSPAVAA